MLTLRFDLRLDLPTMIKVIRSIFPAPRNGLYGKALPKRGAYLSIQVYKRVGISQVEVYERVGKSVI